MKNYQIQIIFCIQVNKTAPQNIIIINKISQNNLNDKNLMMNVSISNDIL